MLLMSYKISDLRIGKDRKIVNAEVISAVRYADSRSRGCRALPHQRVEGAVGRVGYGAGWADTSFAE
jgi:hypothetical protein